MRNTYRLGIDAGGTFTDFVLAEKNGPLRLFKSPSTPDDGTRAISAGLEQISEALGRPVDAIVQECDLCINGTTVALNALIEKKGVKVGLLCTSGHEDSLEIRLGHKEEGYRYEADFPPAHMIVPRHLRRPIGGRILADGREDTALDEEGIRAALRYFREQGVESVAISFVWSVMNPSHERRALELVAEMMPDVFVCAGSEVYPQVREYTRTSTTVVNAYLSPVMRRYVQKIDAYFRSLGAHSPVRYFQSNGGLAVGDAMQDRAVNAINSGPASAPRAGQYFGKPAGLENIITVDMGGTSFDITLTRDGHTNLNKNIDFLRYRIGVPMIQVETLGAGGGSICRVDEFGMLTVGPESAGAEPGPVCYGKGGQLPTVTDANLVMGYLNPDLVLGGRIRLDREAAIRAIRTHVAEPLGISVEKAAYGISTLVNLNMVNGISRVSIERGYDPRDFALLCAGGAAGMHITALAEEIGSTRVLVPKVSSVFCAFGQIISDVRYNYLASEPMRLNAEADLERLNQTFRKLEQQGHEHLLADGFTAQEISCSRTVELRYVGQIHECSIELHPGTLTPEKISALKDDFHRRHEELYTYCEPQNDVELVNIEASLVGRVARPELEPLQSRGLSLDDALTGYRPALFDAEGHWVDTAIYDGNRLDVGLPVPGPAIVEEPTTSIVVRPGWQLVLESNHCYSLTRTA